jgi:hypothetical protein
MNLNEWTPVLRKRLYEYRKQDPENGIHDKREAISAAETLQLECRRRCAHCGRSVTFEKNLAMRGEGFTLDRNDNDVGHTQANCNLKKR